MTSGESWVVEEQAHIHTLLKHEMKTPTKLTPVLLLMMMIMMMLLSWKSNHTHLSELNRRRSRLVYDMKATENFRNFGDGKNYHRKSAVDLWISWGWALRALSLSFSLDAMASLGFQQGEIGWSFSVGLRVGLSKKTHWQTGKRALSHSILLTIGRPCIARTAVVVVVVAVAVSELLWLELWPRGRALQAKLGWRWHWGVLGKLERPPWPRIDANEGGSFHTFFIPLTTPSSQIC